MKTHNSSNNQWQLTVQYVHVSSVSDVLPSSSLTVAVGLLTLSPLGGLGSGTGGCSAVTHVGSAMFMSSLLTELSSWREAAGDKKETVRQGRKPGWAEGVDRRVSGERSSEVSHPSRKDKEREKRKSQVSLHSFSFYR